MQHNNIDLFELLFFCPGYDYSQGLGKFATHSDVDKSICQQTKSYRFARTPPLTL